MTQNKELKKVEIISEKPLEKAKYLKTVMIEAKREDGKKIFWEMDKGHDSVHVLVDNIEDEVLELVAQVRIPVLVKQGQSICIEACAGLVDKDSSIIQIAKEELEEEMGYDVPLEDIIPVRRYCSNVGNSGGTVQTFRTEVRNSMKTSEGGGLELEDIAIVRIPYTEVTDYIQRNGKYSEVFTDATTLFLMQDWLIRRLTK